jgi:CDP-diacylglycerol pyrophosphatase
MPQRHDSSEGREQLKADGPYIKVPKDVGFVIVKEVDSPWQFLAVPWFDRDPGQNRLLSAMALFVRRVVSAEGVLRT